MNSVSLRNPRPRQLKLKQPVQVSKQVKNSNNLKSEKAIEPSEPQCGSGVCEVAWRPSQTTRGGLNSNAS
jgi:hypothetical protein